MNIDKVKQIQAYAHAIAELLYEETDAEQLKTLEGIEETVRGQILEHVSPEIGHFLLQKRAKPKGEEPGSSKASSAQSN
jgi:hypothetical protein